MRGGKNPTASQKKVLTNLGYISKEWLIIKWQDSSAVLRNKLTQEIKTVMFKV